MKTEGMVLGEDNLSQLSHSGLSKKQRKARTAFRYLSLAHTNTNTNTNTHTNAKTNTNTHANTNTNTMVRVRNRGKRELVFERGRLIR